MEMDVKQKKLAKKIALGAVVGLIAAPLVGAAIYGLVGLLVIGGISFVAIQFAPVFATEVSNQALKLFESRVRANPIESLKNLYIEKEQELLDKNKQIETFDTEIRNYDQQAKVFSKQYPEEAETYTEISTKMHTLLEGMIEAQQAAKQLLFTLSRKVEKAEAIYKMAKAAQNVLTLSKSAEAKVFAEIKEKVAFDTVQSEMNRSFAALDLAIRQKDDHQLSLPPAPVEQIQMPRRTVVPEYVRRNG